MTQAKGILPKDDDGTRVLFHDGRLSGYFVGVKLRPDLDATGVQAWLKTISPFVNDLVARLPLNDDERRGHDEDGEKVATVAIGLAPSFFLTGDSLRFEIEPPAAFDGRPAGEANLLPWDTGAQALSAAGRLDADVLFYVTTVFEARVARFVEQLDSTRPDLTSITIARGFQRLEGREPFGYADGVRNIPTGYRTEHVFVHQDGDEADEPEWADDGTYMAFMRIVQNRDAFAALADDASRDAVIGRRRDGSRADLEGVDAHDEPAEPVPNLPASAHVRKAGPRGTHDDVQIFRRGLPFFEAVEGNLRVGLNFVSFQSNLDKFDTVLNDWMLSSNFPVEGAGPDGLLDPARGLTTIESVGVYFVPSYDARFVGATMFDPKPAHGPREGRLVVRKRVVDPNDPGRRFERAGFRFRVFDAAGTQVGGEFVTNSAGRAAFDGKLAIGQTYTLEELTPPISVQTVRVEFIMERPNQQLRVVNTVTQPNTPYGG